MASPEPTTPPTRRPRSVLVTGVPRSGTTWLARELARTRRAGLAGREPMNPRGGQFALGGTVPGWVQLDSPTARQARLLRRCYAGLEPRVLSRYGERQLRAALPGRTTVVKDPFALLSLPAVVAATGAAVVVLYRPAADVLASYRRMGWRADTAELRSLPGGPGGPLPHDDVEAMAEFWNELHRRVLDRLDRVPGAVLVSHPELAAGGVPALEQLGRRLGLGPRDGRADGGARPRRARADGAARLHDFARTPAEVADGWRTQVSDDERARIQAATAEVSARLDLARTGARSLTPHTGPRTSTDTGAS